MAEPMSQVVNIFLSYATGTAAVVCSLGHDTEMSFDEYLHLAYRGSNIRCPVCLCIQSLAPNQ